MITIEQIKDALKAHIAEAEAATPGPWTVEPTSSNRYSLLIRGDTEYAKWSESTQLPSIDAAFITHARTMSPAACKCLLLAIEGLEEVASYTGELYCPGDEYAHGVEYGKSIIGVKAYRRLESIRQEWHNLATK